MEEESSVAKFGGKDWAKAMPPGDISLSGAKHNGHHGGTQRDREKTTRSFPDDSS